MKTPYTDENDWFSQDLARDVRKQLDEATKDDPMLARQIWTALHGLQSEVQVREVMSILVSSKPGAPQGRRRGKPGRIGLAPTHWLAAIVHFRRLAWVGGPGSFLDMPGTVYQAYADCLGFPSPTPRTKGHIPAYATLNPHYQSSLKIAQQKFRRGIPHLWEVRHEGVPVDKRPPMPIVDPPTRSNLNARSPLSEEREKPLSPEQMEQIRNTHGRPTRVIDELESAAMMRVKKWTRWRRRTLCKLKGKHLRFNAAGTLITSLLPPPGVGPKHRGPRELYDDAELVTRHVLRLAEHYRRYGLPFPEGGSPFPPEAWVFPNMVTGQQLHPDSVNRMVEGIGDVVGAINLRPTDVRAGEMTMQLFWGTPVEAAQDLNDHTNPKTDWVYRSKMALSWELPILSELLRIAGLPQTLQPACCLECGGNDSVGIDNLCINCNPEYKPDPRRRHEALARLVARVRAKISSEAFTTHTIHIQKLPESGP